MMWGCFAANGSGALKKVNGIMKKEDYVQYLQESLKSSSRKLGLWFSWVFQQDSDQTHIGSGKEMPRISFGIAFPTS